MKENSSSPNMNNLISPNNDFSIFGTASRGVKAKPPGYKRYASRTFDKCRT